MKKRAKLYLISLTCLSLVIFIVLGFILINRQAEASARQTLQNYLSNTVSLTEIPSEHHQDFVKNLSKSYTGDVRITLLDTDGTVLGDSSADPASMSNHLDRAEIALALANGYGESLRASDTTGIHTLYAARLWQDHYVLRYAIPVSAAREIATQMVPVLLVIFLVMAVLITISVDRFTKKLAAPYEQMLGYIEKMLQSGKHEPLSFTAEYEEMQPIIQYFNYLLEQISGHIAQITEKTTEIQNIVSNMQEGLVLLDSGMNILMINPQASRFLAIPEDSWQKQITYLYRDEAFVAAVNAARAESVHQMVDIQSADSIYRFYINPVPEGGFVLLISDVTEISRLERIRSDFAANVSHELKTPLTSISGFAELIETSMVDNPETIRDYAGKIHLESLRLVRLIDDILRLSAIENGHEQEAASNDPVDVKAIFSYVLELLDTQMKKKGVQATIQGDLKLNISKEHIDDIALNLCDNGVKYNRENGTVSIRLFENGFSVTDTGIGIPQEHQSRIFERFYRVDTARSRKTGGTGLGLSITKHIAALYGATITVESSAAGSTFTVVFPSRLVVK